MAKQKSKKVLKSETTKPGVEKPEVVKKPTEKPKYKTVFRPSLGTTVKVKIN